MDPRELQRRREIRFHLRSLQTVEQVLRKCLHIHGLEENTRNHMERAIAHAREARASIETPRTARSVERLIEDCQTGERFLEKVKAYAKEQSRGITP